MPIKAPSLEETKFPVVVCWEIAYPNGDVSKGGCLVEELEAYCSFIDILSAEARDEKNIVAPLQLVPLGTKFCPKHGVSGAYPFCTECGEKTQDPVRISQYVYEIRYCPEHGDSLEKFNFFCGRCGTKTMIRTIMNSE